MNIARKLSAVERGHIAHTLARGPSFLPTYNRFVLEGEGTLDLQQWQAAARQAAAANPGLHLRLIGNLGWMRWATDGAEPRVRLIENSTWDGYSNAGMEFMQEPLDARHGPLAEIILLPGSPARVVFRTHHATMDGTGTHIFINDVFRALNSEAPVGARVDINDADIIRDKRIPVPVQPDPNCLSVSGPATATTQDYQYRRVRLEQRVRNVIPKLLERLGQYARTQNEGDGRVRFRVTVDWRRELPDDGLPYCTNLTGFLFVDVDADTTERDLVRTLRNKLKDNEHLFVPGLLAAMNWIPLRLLNRQLHAAGLKLHERKRYVGSGTVSSLGEMEAGQYQCPGFVARNCFALPVPFFLTPLFITVWGNPHGLDLVIGMPGAFGDNGRIEKLADFLRDSLTR